MKQTRSLLSILVASIVSIILTAPMASGAQPYPPAESGPQAMLDSVYVDDFNRPDGPLGSDWLADPTMQIVSQELDNIDTDPSVNDIAVYTAYANPLGVSFQWSPTADQDGIDQGGLALRLSGTPGSVNGYYLFKNDSDNRYVLWTIVNGTLTEQVTRVTSNFPYPEAGDEYQVVLRSDGFGHHFDIFYNDQYDVTVTDALKLQGNEPVWYTGVMLGGNYNNNVDNWTFVKYDDDETPPDAVSDLTAIPVSGSSVKLRWTAPGDDGSSGQAGSYDVRFASFPIDEGNWGSAVRYIGEPRPSPAGSLDSLTISNLQPETTYWFAMKTTDGWPKDNVSGLSNVESSETMDDVPPSTINDLTVVSVGSRTVLLSWTAPGDSDTTGTADEYDVRFSTNPIETVEDFQNSARGTGEPAPAPYGSYQEYTVNKLIPNTTYYFAVRTEDEQNNRSDISNTVGATTILYPWALDGFERPQLGEDYWVADPELQVIDGELSNVSTEERWDFSAIFSEVVDIKEIAYWWGEDVDVEGAEDGGALIGMDSPDPDGNGYLLFRNSNTDKIALWDVSAGVPSAPQIASEDAGTIDPAAGDQIRIVVSSDMNGNHFDYWVNGDFRARVSDPDKIHSVGGTTYAGIMLHGNRNNNVATYSVASNLAVLPPAPFDLFMPFDGDTIDTATPLLDWTDSWDLNPDDSVRYGVWYGTDPNFIENTVFVDSIYVSEYQVPGNQLGRILRNYLEQYAQGGKAGGNSPQELPDNAQIYWRVRARDTTELETMANQLDWSFYVSVPDAPLPFDLIRPADEDTVGTMFPRVVWHEAIDPDPDSESITYELWYDRAPDFAQPTIIGGLADTSFTLPGLLNLSWYYWKVFAEDEDGLVGECTSYFSFWVDTSYVTGIDGDVPATPELPRIYTLGQNYPNPFNPMTSISYDVPESAEGEVQVHMDVYNVRGVKVRTLVNEVKEAGSYVVTWDGKNDRGERVTSGIYFYRMSAGEFSSTKKMVILK